jgi:polar amino acid transport system ATP-binding protein
VISVRNLKKSYPGHAVFDGLNLEVATGECVALLGASGAGKSTLLRCINGLEPFESGEIIVDDVDLKASDHAQIRQIRRRVGLVFQQFNLFAHLTALENVSLAPRFVKKIPKGVAESQARELLGKVGLSKKESRYPDQLSGGEQQRVAIARALAMKPTAMLFDEPTSSLDAEMTAEVIAVIKSLIAEGMTSLIVTHVIDVARQLSHRILRIENGRILSHV